MRSWPASSTRRSSSPTVSLCAAICLSVSLGTEGENHRARLPRDASAEQIDAALRAVAVGLTVSVAEEPARRFEALARTR